MGLDYRIELYYRRGDLTRALEVLAARAFETEGTSPVQCLLDGGRRVSVPLGGRSPSAQDLSPDVFEQELGLVYFRFEADRFVRSYLLDPPVIGQPEVQRTKDGRWIATLGFRLHVECGVRYCAVALKASTTRESILFEQSASIHDLFLNLGEETDAVAGVLDAEERGFSPLGRPWLGIHASPSRDECSAEGAGIDEWVEAVMRFYSDLDWDWQARLPR